MDDKDYFNIILKSSFYKNKKRDRLLIILFLILLIGGILSLIIFWPRISEKISFWKIKDYRTVEFSGEVFKDADKDGLSDDQEDLYGTNKNKTDTDGDGYTDYEEIVNGYNPLGEGKLETNLNEIATIDATQNSNNIDSNLTTKEQKYLNYCDSVEESKATQTRQEIKTGEEIIPNFKVDDVCLTDQELELADLINEYRRTKGLPSIVLSKSLSYVAKFI